jgi:hypothetical protein
MKKKIWLPLLLCLAFPIAGCWDHHWDGDDGDLYQVTVTVDSDCEDPPFDVYLDGTHSGDRIGEIAHPGASEDFWIEEGWHTIRVRDDHDDWIYDESFVLDEDDEIHVHC